jgi:hypothetical protein
MKICTSWCVRVGTRSRESVSLAYKILILGVALGGAIWFGGCSGSVQGQSTGGPTPSLPPRSFSVSGIISPVSSGAGVALVLSGAATATTSADSSGSYNFMGLADGKYSVTASRAGYTFNPSTRLAVINGANVTGLDFSATAQTTVTFSISGTISPAAGGSGATVALSGATAATTTASSSGAYVFMGLTSGTYTVIPANSGYTFSPASQTVTVGSANVGGVNCTAAAVQSHSVVLSWDASTSPISGYNVYRSTVSGGQYVRINSTLISSGLMYTDADIQGGTTYYYVSTAVDSTGTESTHSNEALATIP